MPGDDSNLHTAPVESNSSFSTNNFPPDAPDLSKILHDLRTPVTAILGLAEIVKILLEVEPLNKEEISGYVREIEQEALRMREFLAHSQY